MESIRWCPVEALVSRHDSSRSTEKPMQSPYEVHYSTCSCDFREFECLPSAECVQAVQASSDELILGGVQARLALKEKYPSTPDYSGVLGLPDSHPLGKLVTYEAIGQWRSWIAGAGMSHFYSSLAFAKCIDPQRYPDCRDRGLFGPACFWQPFGSREDFGELERGALRRAGRAATNSSAGTDLERFWLKVALAIVPQKSDQDDEILNSLPADEYLLSLAHIARIQFNMQPSLRELYKKCKSVVNAGVGQLRVGVHIRRADSCSELVKDGYMDEASKIDTHAQMTNVRLCYSTNVCCAASKTFPACPSKSSCLRTTVEDRFWKRSSRWVPICSRAALGII